MCSCDTCWLAMITREIVIENNCVQRTNTSPQTSKWPRHCHQSSALCTENLQSQQCNAGERSFHMHFKRRKFFIPSVRRCIGLYAFVMTIEWMNSCSWTKNLCPHITDNYCYCYSFVLFHLTYVLFGVFRCCCCLFVSYFLVHSFRFPSFEVFACNCIVPHEPDWHHQ